MQVSTTGTTDSELLARAAQGDESALQALLDRHLAAVRAWLIRRCRRPDIADELAMDVFLPQRLVNFAGQAAPRSFLIGIAQNLWLHRLRDIARERQRGVRSLDQLHDDGHVDPPDPAPEQADQLARRDLAERMLERLDEREREIFRRRYLLGQEFADIAAAIGEPSVDTIRSIHRRTLLRLRTEWTDSGKELTEGLP